MDYNYGKDDKSALQAKYDAQKIAFAPIMFHAAKALRDLGILKYLLKKRRKGCTIEEVAEALDLSVYGVKVLLEAGISLEMVYAVDHKYFITKTGYFVESDELTRVNMDFTQDVNYRGMESLQDSITKGKPEGLKEFGSWPTVYEALAELPEKVRESWFAFDHYYSDYAFPEVLPFIFESKPKKILDVGGNTGKFSIFCAKNNPDVKMTILDLPGQVNDANKNIEKENLSDRINTHALNLLDNSIPFPKGHDAVWMSQFLDCFSQEQILGLLNRSNEAIDENGRVFILETYWDLQQFPASTYSLHATSLYFTAIANGNSQMYHSEDMRKLVEKAGLLIEKEIENIGVSHTLFVCKKA
ncbi:MAG: SAM-dependent methyltransferase [Marinilabiliales bacterium]|nr:MAG: SAM-dependent methyltransferase [Marinilabiliales bacterium]